MLTTVEMPLMFRLPPIVATPENSTLSVVLVIKLFTLTLTSVLLV
jgi:hypothetical protein